MLAVKLAFVAGADSLIQHKLCHYMQKYVNGAARKNHENVNGFDKTLVCTDNKNNKMF